MRVIKLVFMTIIGFALSLFLIWLLGGTLGCSRQKPPPNLTEAYYAGEEVPPGGFLYLGGPYNPRWPHQNWHEKMVRELRAAGWTKPIVVGVQRMGPAEDIDPGMWARQHQRASSCIVYWLPLGENMGTGLETRIDFGIAVGQNVYFNRFNNQKIQVGAPIEAMGTGVFRRVAMENNIPFVDNMKALAEKAVERCQ